MIVYMSIGNSDNKLSQLDWSDFAAKFESEIRNWADEVFGVWYSHSTSEWQNMCVAANLREPESVKHKLRELRDEYDQESIAWAEVPNTEFI